MSAPTAQSADPFGVIVEYASVSGGSAGGITVGPDGNIWYTLTSANRVATTSAGITTEFSNLTVGASPRAIVRGPDGNLWFTEEGIGKIARMSTSGSLFEFPLGANAQFLTVGSDGALYAAASGTKQIIRVVPLTGAATLIHTTTGTPTAIAPGVNGNLLIATTSPDAITELSPNGVVISTFVNLPVGAGISSFAFAPDGGLWVTEPGVNRVARLSAATFASGGIPIFVGFVEFSNGIGVGATPQTIVRGPDANMWFTELVGNKIARINTSNGEVTEYGTGLALASGPSSLIVGNDGNLWFTQSSAGRVARFGTQVAVATTIVPTTTTTTTTTTTPAPVTTKATVPPTAAPTLPPATAAPVTTQPPAPTRVTAAPGRGLYKKVCRTVLRKGKRVKSCSYVRV